MVSHPVLQGEVTLSILPLPGEDESDLVFSDFLKAGVPVEDVVSFARDIASDTRVVFDETGEDA